MTIFLHFLRKLLSNNYYDIDVLEICEFEAQVVGWPQL